MSVMDEPIIEWWCGIFDTTQDQSEPLAEFHGTWAYCMQQASDFVMNEAPGSFRVVIERVYE